MATICDKSITQFSGPHVTSDLHDKPTLFILNLATFPLEKCNSDVSPDIAYQKYFMKLLIVQE